MKILFANPPTFEKEGKFNRPVRFPTYNYATPVIHPPLFLAYAASFTRSKGHDVTFIDAQAEPQSVEQFLTKIKQIDPDVIVFETSTPSVESDSKVSSMIKELTNSVIIFVGTHVSALPEESLKTTSADAVIIGEYELSLEEFIRKGGNKTKGICYKEGREIIRNGPRELIEDLDALPFPARDLIPNYRYFDPILKNPFTFVLAGRGCPHRCIFCNWPQVMTGRRYRFRSPKNIVDELEEIQNNYNFSSILFNDDTFTANREHALDVCNEIERRNLKLDWACYTRADNRDKEMLKRMRDTRCFLLKVGVESGNQEILQNMKKGYVLSNVKKGISTMKSLGFHVHGTFVFGLPGETLKTIKQTVEFAKEVSPTTVQFSTAVPYPGTEFYNYLKKNNFLNTNNWKEYFPLNPVFNYKSLSANQLKQAVKTAYRNYYFRYKYVKIGVREFLIQPNIVLSNIRRLVNFVR